MEVLLNEGVLTNQEFTKSIKLKENAFPKGIPSCGVDALRLTLCHSDICEHFINFNVDECIKNSRFLNKIWNATKFTLGNCEKYSVSSTADPIISKDDLSPMDSWILSRLACTLIEVTQQLNDSNVGCAYLWRQFFYDNLCDVYIEATKHNFLNNNSKESRLQCEVLKICLAIGLRFLGIYTPYLANELLSYLPSQMHFEVRLGFQ